MACTRIHLYIRRNLAWDPRGANILTIPRKRDQIDSFLERFTGDLVGQKYGTKSIVSWLVYRWPGWAAFSRFFPFFEPALLALTSYETYSLVVGFTRSRTDALPKFRARIVSSVGRYTFGKTVGQKSGPKSIVYQGVVFWANCPPADNRDQVSHFPARARILGFLVHYFRWRMF